MATQAIIHIAKSLKSQPHEPKLVKEYVCPNAPEKKARAYNKVYKSLGNKWLK